MTTVVPTNQSKRMDFWYLNLSSATNEKYYMQHRLEETERILFSRGAALLLELFIVVYTGGV